MIAPPNEVPDEFTLLLSNDGHARRHCHACGVLINKSV